jgi:hypothetical protein
LDLDISEADLDLSGNVEMEDATIPETETDKPMPRESKFKKGLAKRTGNISANRGRPAAKCWTRI